MNPNCLYITLQQPFDLDATVDSWIFPDIQPTPDLKSPGQYARCLLVAGKQVPVRIAQLRKGLQPLLSIEWPKGEVENETQLLKRIGWLLGWDVDTSLALERVQADPIIAHLTSPLAGLKPFTQPSLFEALVKAILQQQISYRLASQIIRDLVVAYGPKRKLGSLEVWGFPSAAQLDKVSDDGLRACRIGYKTRYLKAIARQIVRGELDLEALASEATASVLETLDALQGVGPWTAELAVLSGLRRLEVFPCDDLGVRNLVSRLYLESASAKRKDVETVAQRWGSQASMVLYFLMAAQVLNLV